MVQSNFKVDFPSFDAYNLPFFHSSNILTFTELVKVFTCYLEIFECIND